MPKRERRKYRNDSAEIFSPEEGKIPDRVSKNDKICHICILRQKGVFLRNEKYGTLSIYESSDDVLPNWPKL